MVPAVEKVRMVNSGTEACMSAIRLARGYTGREKFIKSKDVITVMPMHSNQSRKGAVTLGIPDSPGVTKGTAQDTLLAPFNDLAAVENIVLENKNE